MSWSILATNRTIPLAVAVSLVCAILIVVIAVAAQPSNRRMTLAMQVQEIVLNSQ